MGYKRENPPNRGFQENVFMKYFTTPIEDLRLGYECEKRVFDYSLFHDIFLPKDATKEEYDKAWEDYYNSPQVEYKKHTITKDDFHFITWLNERLGSCRGHFRTAYLTKEQIEAEGWKSLDELKLTRENSGVKFWKPYMVKGPYQLLYYKRLEISGPNISYLGDCKDINTFRIICKLLNI